MFDFLKKKISGFIENITQTKKEDEQPVPEPKSSESVSEVESKPEIPIGVPLESKTEQISEEKTEPKTIAQESKIPKSNVKEQPLIKEQSLLQSISQIKPESQKPISVPIQNSIPTQKPAPTPPVSIPLVSSAEEKSRLKLGALSTIKSFVFREVELSESEVKKMLDDFELEMLEADVELGVAESIKTGLEQRLVGAKIERSKMQAHVNAAIRETLLEILINDRTFDLVERIKSIPKPAKIIFLGINGAGKTTTMAKIAKLLQSNDQKIVFAAADTFRAAAIEQLCVHAERLGVKTIKRDYGSDPTSVAYDAVNYGKAHGTDAVLIDTAGRQDTNLSLINEMKKMVRVIQPDLKIYIGESIAGNAIIEQISSFNREIGIDAVILSKLDCDPKGGTMLSINKATGIPIIYVGIGQKYEDLEKFDPLRIVNRIVG